MRRGKARKTKRGGERKDRWRKVGEKAGRRGLKCALSGEGGGGCDGPDDELAEVTSRAKSLLLALAVGSSRDVGPEMMDRSPSRSHSSPPSISHPFTLL